MQEITKSKGIGDPVRNAAWLYYAAELTQSEVAKYLGVSRQTVANYLAEAKKLGLVHVELSPELLSVKALANEIAERYHLQAVHIVPASEGDQTIRQMVALEGALALLQLVEDGDMIGVASGRTISALGKNLPQKQMKHSKIVQVSGSSILSPEASPEVCTSDIAQALGARCLNLSAPAYLSNAKLAEELYEEPAIREHFKMIEQCKILLFGIGELREDTEMSFPLQLSQDIRDSYLKAGAKVVMLGRFFDAEGVEQKGPLSGRIMGVSVEVAREIPIRLAVCGGKNKEDALKAALKSNLITHLVLDHSLASVL